MRGTVSIDHDERDFWHVNFFRTHDDPGDDSDTPDAFATTKKGATLEDAISLARRKFKPDAITVWSDCPDCGGMGTVFCMASQEYDACDECEEGKVVTVME